MKRFIMFIFLMTAGIAAFAQFDNGVYYDGEEEEVQEKGRLKKHLTTYDIDEINFIVDEGRIIWQKVYETDLDFEDLKEKFAETTSDCNVIDDSMTGKLENYIPNLGGRRRNLCPIYITNSQFFAKVKLQFKPGRYRVTIRNITTKDLIEVSFNAGYVSAKSDSGSLEHQCLNSKKGKIKEISTDIIKILDESFTKTFTFEEDEDDDW